MEFREMLRKNQQLPAEECITILQQQLRGVLSVLGDGGYPYGVPLNHWYNPADGKLYFHCGLVGHKLDAIRSCHKASFCVLDDGAPLENHWALQFRSVVVFGRIRMVEDVQQKENIARQLSLKFTQDEAYIDEEIRQALKRTACFVLEPEHITGKRVKEL